MKAEFKKTHISAIANNLLDKAVPEMRKAISKAVNSSAVDVDAWNPEINPMVLPKSILIAVMENEADQYKATGTSFGKEVKKNVKNIKLFI